MSRYENKSAARRVCHLRATNFFGGPEKQIAEHAVTSVRYGWETTVATFDNDPGAADLESSVAQRGVETFRVSARGGFDFRQISRLKRELGRRKIDLLVTHGYRPNLIGYLATRGCATEQLAYMRGFTGENWRVRAYEGLDRWVLRRVAGVVCVSRATSEQLRNRGVSTERLAVVSNAVHFQDAIEPAPLRGEFGIPDGSPVCVAAGRLSPEKGHALLVEAMPRLPAEVRLVLFGDGPLLPELRRRAAELGLEGRVHFAGFRSDVLRYLAAATLVVNPSHTEGLPNVLLESLMVGVPVVATAVGGCPELLHDVGGGLLVPAGDPAALADGILRALNLGTELTQLAAGARQRIRTAYSFETQAQRLFALYESMCESGSPRPAPTAERATEPIEDRR